MSATDRQCQPQSIYAEGETNPRRISWIDGVSWHCLDICSIESNKTGESGGSFVYGSENVALHMPKRLAKPNSAYHRRSLHVTPEISKMKLKKNVSQEQ
jgi:hypothetical protein